MKYYIITLFLFTIQFVGFSQTKSTYKTLNRILFDKIVSFTKEKLALARLTIMLKNEILQK